MRDSELPEDPPSVAVAGELHCIECMYDLRMLPVDGMCPECGRSIRETVSLRERIPMVKVRRLRFLLQLLMGECLILCVCVFMSFLDDFFGTNFESLGLVLLVSVAFAHPITGATFLVVVRRIGPYHCRGYGWPISACSLMLLAAAIAIEKRFAEIIAFILLATPLYLATLGVAQGVVISANSLAHNFKLKGRWGTTITFLWSTPVLLMFSFVDSYGRQRGWGTVLVSIGHWGQFALYGTVFFFMMGLYFVILRSVYTMLNNR